MDATPRLTEKTLVAAGDPLARTFVAAAAAAAASASAGPRLDRGALVDRYVLINQLGAGGMGVVYAAYDPELDRKVALKLVLPGEGEEPRRSEGHIRLLREAQALARLAHPNVVGIHDVGAMGEQVWIAMEFVEGATFGDWLRHEREVGTCSWRRIVAVMAAAGEGLAAAHAAGLLHRDFKPENVMVGADGRVRVMDFGLARAGHGASSSDTSISRPGAALSATGRSGPGLSASGLSASGLSASGLSASGLSASGLTASGLTASGVSSLQLRLTQAGDLTGTPMYMSPEQFRGDELSAASDQFSFCVALWEALFGERPFPASSLVELATAVVSGRRRPAPRRSDVPTWLRRVVERGLAVAPEARWPSMAALLRALSRGQSQARQRRWWTAIGAVAAVAAAVGLYTQHEHHARAVACEVEAASIDAVWSGDARARVRDGILATGASYAATTAAKVAPWIDRYVDEWRGARARICREASVDETLDLEALDRARWCLDERRLELAAILTELGQADAGGAQEAIAAVTGLRQVSPCLDPTVLSALPAPPEEAARAAIIDVRASLARASALGAAGKYTEGAALAGEAVTAAEALGWTPLEAEALRERGHLLQLTGDYAAAAEALVAAYRIALRARAWEVAVDAATEATYVVGFREARYGEGRLWAEHAAAMIDFAADPLGLREAERRNHLASIDRATGDLAAAAAGFAEVVRIVEAAKGPEHPSVATSLNNLGIVRWSLGEYDEARRLQERALAIWEETLGPDHPFVATSLTNLAGNYYSLGEYAAARRLHERALSISERALGPHHPEITYALNNLAIVLRAQGELVEARALLVRSLAIREAALGPDHPGVATILNNLADVDSALGDREAAIQGLERALAIREASLGPDHPDVATALNNLAGLLMEEGDAAAARERYARALAIRERAPGQPRLADSLIGLAEVAMVEGRSPDAIASAERALRVSEEASLPPASLAEARFALARALWGGGVDRSRAQALARAALEAYRSAEDQEGEVARVSAWIDAHGG
ncbi:MAG: serine/threonine-protein kinase [Nannocystaceae bacterium]